MLRSRFSRPGRTLLWAVAASSPLWLGGPLSAADGPPPPADKPPAESAPAAKAPAESAPAVKAPAPLTLIIEGEVDAALAPVAGKLTTLFYECYPKLLARFEHPARPAPRRIRLVFDPNLRAPAVCSGDKISVSTEWLRKHPNDVGLLTHELTHAVQAYPKADPGWLTEGIADYARHVYGPREDRGWKLPTRVDPKQNWTASYGVTASFLVRAEERFPGLVDKLHRRMQDREFTMDDFKAFTERDLPTLWKECMTDPPK